MTIYHLLLEERMTQPDFYRHPIRTLRTCLKNWKDDWITTRRLVSATAKAETMPLIHFLKTPGSLACLGCARMCYASTILGSIDCPAKWTLILRCSSCGEGTTILSSINGSTINLEVIGKGGVAIFERMKYWISLPNDSRNYTIPLYKS